MEHKAFLSTWCKTFLHKREKEVVFLNTLKVSLVLPPQEGPFQVMFAGTQHTEEQKELNARGRRCQSTTKITSASADSRIKSSWKMMSLLVRTLCLCLVLTIGVCSLQTSMRLELVTRERQLCSQSAKA